MTTRNWDDWQFLIGDWIGEGGGVPGQGGGGQSFHFDLQGQILLRENHVDFPATPDHPAFAHDDLTIIYPDTEGKMRAIYYDNEGHVTSYTVSVTSGSIVMVSDPEPPGPRSRTTFLQGKNGTLINRFELAPPDDPEAFTLYVEGTSKKK